MILCTTASIFSDFKRFSFFWTRQKMKIAFEVTGIVPFLLGILAGAIGLLLWLKISSWRRKRSDNLENSPPEEQTKQTNVEADSGKSEKATDEHTSDEGGDGSDRDSDPTITPDSNQRQNETAPVEEKVQVNEEEKEPENRAKEKEQLNEKEETEPMDKKEKNEEEVIYFEQKLIQLLRHWCDNVTRNPVEIIWHFDIIWKIVFDVEFDLSKVAETETEPNVATPDEEMKTSFFNQTAPANVFCFGDFSAQNPFKFARKWSHFENFK